jgi:ribonuclease HI
MSKSRNVVIYTDGACSGNPGPGGWASLLRFGKNEKVLSGGLPQTTNNRMELQAVAEGLAALKAPCSVVIKSDSRYVVTSLMIYMYDWEKRGWKKSDGTEVAHVDLWKQIFELSKTHKLFPMWVKGHSGDTDNERVDALAKSAIPA